MSYRPFNAKAMRVVSFVIALMAIAVLLLPGGPLYGQEAIVTIYHVENDEGPVTTLSATDPEGVMPPMIWSLVTAVSAGIDADDIEDAEDFKISDAGVLTFAIGDDEDPPDFEDPQGGMPANNEYRVVVQASDGGKTQAVSYFKVVVLVTDEEETGKVTWTVDPDGTDTAEGPQPLRQFQDGAALAASVTDPDRTPSDADGDAIPAAGINWKWYRGSDVIAGQTGPSYTVTAADVGKRIKVVATYTDRRGTGKSAELVSSHPVKQARANNADPEFSPTAVTRTVAENTAAGMNIGSPVAATDDDDTVLTYSLGGEEDGASFDIDAATGQLMTKADLDYETKLSYSVAVTATDPSGAATDPVATVTINVTAMNEKPTFTAGTMGMADDHAENATSLVIATYAANDREGGNVTLSLMGDDAALFELAGDTESGTNVSQELSFKEKPDFEMPGDDNGDNIYEVTVVASDGSNEAMLSVTVKVTDAEEAGKVTLSTQDARIGNPITASVEDSDGGITDVEWQWHQVAATGDVMLTDDTEIDDATDDTYTPVDDDDNMRLLAMASYTDRTYVVTDPFIGNDDASATMFTNTARSMVTTVVRDDPANKAPEFSESATQRFVLENSEAGMPIGLVVEAEDNDAGQMLTYSLGGADKASFAIDPVDVDGKVGGQIRTKAALDHEMKDRHTVTVTATDSSGEANDSDTITVTIHVIDLDEGPEIDGPTTTVEIAENDEGPVTTLSATDPEGVMPPMIWSLVTAVSAGIDADDIEDAEDFKISDAGVLTFAIGDDEDPPDFEDPQGGMPANNEYRVVVQASDGGKTQAGQLLQGSRLGH